MLQFGDSVRDERIHGFCLQSYCVILSITLNLHLAKMYYLAWQNLLQLTVSSFQSPEIRTLY